MAVTLVVAWDRDLKTPLAMQRVANKREARIVAQEFDRDYAWSPRTSFYEEVDFLATEEGMTHDERARAMQQVATWRQEIGVAEQAKNI